MYSKKALFIFLFLFSLRPTLMAQMTFMATTDARQVAVGDFLELKFTLTNARGNAFSPPAISGFQIVSGPNAMNSMTIVNGQASSSMSYIYTLQAKKEGKYTIGVASIRAGGKNLASQPIEVEIVKSKTVTTSPNSSTKGNAKDAVFIRAELSKPTAFVGEQIILDYKLYSRVNITGMNLVKEADYKGFFKQDIEQYNRNENFTEIGGKRYLVKILSRIALYPQQVGSLPIDPLTVQAGVMQAEKKQNNRDPFDDFFMSQDVKQVNLSSNGLVVNVKALPTASVPPSFSGAVGRYDFTPTISRTDASTDDAISLKITISGNGDAKKVQAPTLPFIEGLEIYAPKVLSEKTDETQGEWITTKEIEYLILPKKAGKYSIKPEFSYFDTEKGSFTTLSPNVFNLNIIQGNNPNAQISAADGRRQGEIRGIKTMASFTKVNRNSFLGSWLFWFLFFIPFLLLGGIIAYKNHRTYLNSLDKDLLRSQNAYKTAQKRLKAAEIYLTSNQQKAFLEEISRTLFGFVSDKFNIPLAEFTKANAVEKLRTEGVESSLIFRFEQILQQCEIALFAGQNTQITPKSIFEDTQKWLQNIHQNTSNNTTT